MKSEKAKEMIEKYAYGTSRNSALTMLKKTCIICVELAEQEAEGRMREKAVEAFLSYCYCEEHRYVRKRCENCESYKSFIQKLNEE